MELRVNGKPTSVEHAKTIQDLLDELGYKNDFIAVARNHVCVPRAAFKETRLEERDDIEIIAPMAGG